MTRKKSDQEQAPMPLEDQLREQFGDEVTLYPIDGVFINGVPHEQHTVDPERAAELLAYFPPAFTTEAPAEAPPTTTTEPVGDPDTTPQEV